MCRFCSRPWLVGLVKIHTRGTRYSLGSAIEDTESRWAIWEQSTGAAVYTYPATEQEWAEAWSRYSLLEKGTPLSSAAATPGGVWGVLSIACGLVGFLLLPILFGPLAVVFGMVAVSMNQKIGWVGIILGGVSIVIVATALANVQNALNGL